MRPETRYERAVMWLVDRIHGDAAYSWRNVVANRLYRLFLGGR